MHHGYPTTFVITLLDAIVQLQSVTLKKQQNRSLTVCRWRAIH